MSGARDVTVVTTQKFSVITPRMAPRKDDPYDCINMQQQPATDNPMTVAEHVEAGTLKVGRRDPNVPAELYGDDRSDLSDWEDY